MLLDILYPSQLLKPPGMENGRTLIRKLLLQKRVVNLFLAILKFKEL